MVKQTLTIKARDARQNPQPGDLLLGFGPDGIQRYVRVHWVSDTQVGLLRAADFGQRGNLIRVSRSDFTQQTQGAEIIQEDGCDVDGADAIAAAEKDGGARV